MAIQDRFNLEKEISGLHLIEDEHTACDKALEMVQDQPEIAMRLYDLLWDKFYPENNFEKNELPVDDKFNATINELSHIHAKLHAKQRNLDPVLEMQSKAVAPLLAIGQSLTALDAKFLQSEHGNFKFEIIAVPHFEGKIARTIEINLKDKEHKQAPILNMVINLNKTGEFLIDDIVLTIDQVIGRIEKEINNKAPEFKNALEAILKDIDLKPSRSASQTLKLKAEPDINIDNKTKTRLPFLRFFSKQK